MSPTRVNRLGVENGDIRAMGSRGEEWQEEGNRLLMGKRSVRTGSSKGNMLRWKGAPVEAPSMGLAETVLAPANGGQRAKTLPVVNAIFTL